MATEIEIIDTDLQKFSESIHRDKLKYINFALRFVRERAVAEDLVDDSFISFWTNRSNISDCTNFNSYFYTIIKNNCLNWLRDKDAQIKIQKKILDTSYRLLQYDIASLEDYDTNLIFTQEIRVILQDQLKKMPELTRMIFNDSRFNDMTYEEIAKKYDISVWKVSREIQFALNILRIELKDYLPAFVAAIAYLSLSK